jgi:hypothetical protein
MEWLLSTYWHQGYSSKLLWTTVVESQVVHLGLNPFFKGNDIFFSFAVSKVGNSSKICVFFSSNYIKKYLSLKNHWLRGWDKGGDVIA